MECKHAQEKLADYLGDELSSSCRVAFEDHLATCPECRREVEALQTTLHCLGQLVWVGRFNQIPELRSHICIACSFPVF